MRKLSLKSIITTLLVASSIIGTVALMTNPNISLDVRNWAKEIGEFESTTTTTTSAPKPTTTPTKKPTKSAADRLREKLEEIVVGETEDDPNSTTADTSTGTSTGDSSSTSTSGSASRCSESADCPAGQTCQSTPYGYYCGDAPTTITDTSGSPSSTSTGDTSTSTSDSTARCSTDSDCSSGQSCLSTPYGYFCDDTPTNPYCSYQKTIECENQNKICTETISGGICSSTSTGSSTSTQSAPEGSCSGPSDTSCPSGQSCQSTPYGYFCDTIPINEYCSYQKTIECEKQSETCIETIGGGICTETTKTDSGDSSSATKVDERPAPAPPPTTSSLGRCSGRSDTTSCKPGETCQSTPYGYFCATAVSSETYCDYENTIRCDNLGVKCIEDATGGHCEERAFQCTPGQSECAGSTFYRFCQSNGEWSETKSCREGAISCQSGRCVFPAQPECTEAGYSCTSSSACQSQNGTTATNSGCGTGEVCCDTKIDTCTGAGYSCLEQTTCNVNGKPVSLYRCPNSQLCCDTSSTPGILAELGETCDRNSDCNSDFCDGTVCVSIDRGQQCDETIYGYVSCRQTDPRWDDVVVREAGDCDEGVETIKSLGCGQSATASLIATHINSSMNPSVLNARHYQSAGTCDGTLHSENIDVLEEYDFESESYRGIFTKLGSYISNNEDPDIDMEALMSMYIVNEDGQEIPHHTTVVGAELNPFGFTTTLILNDPWYGPNTKCLPKVLGDWHCFAQDGETFTITRPTEGVITLVDPPDEPVAEVQ